MLISHRKFTMDLKYNAAIDQYEGCIVIKDSKYKGELLKLGKTLEEAQNKFIALIDEYVPKDRKIH